MNCSNPTPCAACPRTHRLIPGDGILLPPVPYRRIIAIGERPGQDEYGPYARSRPFTGRVGEEFNNNYLPLAGLSRDDIYFCNAIRCGVDGKRKPTQAEIDSCSRHFLPYELDAIRPHYVILMGAVACSLVDDDEHGPINLTLQHGMPLRRKLFGREYLCVPMIHPATGLHDTKKMTPMMEDWSRLRLIIDGSYRAPVDQYRGKTDYRLVDASGLEKYLYANLDLTGASEGGYTLYGGLDTETDDGKLWCITISVAPGTGVMFMASDLVALNTFRKYQSRYHWFIHNASFDVDKLEQHADPIRLTHYSCTQQAVYHRGNLPQGLKALGYRLMGIRMTSYEDTVLPWSRRTLLDWWLDALLLTGDPIVTERVSEKTGKALKPKIATTKLHRRLAQIHTHASNPSKTEYDPWKKWSELDEEDRRSITDKIGQPPQQSIIHVPPEHARDYAVQDADVGLRLGLWLRYTERGFRKRAGL